VNKTAQRVCIYCGPVMLVVWLAGFAICHYIVPPHAMASAVAIRDNYIHHTFRIRLGLIMTMFAVALLVPFSAVFATQMRRIEGKHSVLAGTQITSGAVLSLEFIVPVMVWLTAAYRPSAISPSTSRMLNDMGWIMFVAVISTVIVQIASIAFAIFLDKRENPIFPRWFGYLNAWVALLLAPAGLIAFFHHGPFSWRGMIGFFLPLTVYSIWMFTSVAMLLRAVNNQTVEADEIDPGVSLRFAELEAQLAAAGLDGFAQGAGNGHATARTTA
jgi:hypothetical protein